jgi:aldehyde:ferredoxin oxidoreductase
MSMRTYLLLVFERETGLDYWVDAITRRGPQTLRDDLVGVCKFAGMTDEDMAKAVGVTTGLEVTADELQAVALRTHLRGWRIERGRGMRREDYVMPDEAHRELPRVQLPHFNTPEFFAALRDRVVARFDELAAAAGSRDGV